MRNGYCLATVLEIFKKMTLRAHGMLITSSMKLLGWIQLIDEMKIQMQKVFDEIVDKPITVIAII